MDNAKQSVCVTKKSICSYKIIQFFTFYVNKLRYQHYEQIKKPPTYDTESQRNYVYTRENEGVVAYFRDTIEVRQNNLWCRENSHVGGDFPHQKTFLNPRFEIKKARLSVPLSIRTTCLRKCRAEYLSYRLTVFCLTALRSKKSREPNPEQVLWMQVVFWKQRLLMLQPLQLWHPQQLLPQQRPVLQQQLLRLRRL